MQLITSNVMISYGLSGAVRVMAGVVLLIGLCKHKAVPSFGSNLVKGTCFHSCCSYRSYNHLHFSQPLRDLTCILIR